MAKPNNVTHAHLPLGAIPLKTTLSRAEARRVALAAQGFADGKPTGRIDSRLFDRLLSRIKVVQLDSVNVSVRTHYVPAFSRLGQYRLDRFDNYAYSKRKLFEGWGHVASLMPVEDYPLMRHRMDEANPWPRLRSFIRENSGLIEGVYAQVAERGPLTVSDLQEPGRRSGPWWGLSDGKIALEWLFQTGRLAASRRGNFVRLYDLTERAIPASALDIPAPSRQDAQRDLLRRSAQALGVGTLSDIADYYRIKTPQARPRLLELVEQGELVKARVEGWRQPAYLYREAKLPRQIEARALLSPFDSLIWFRERTERLFDFFYRIEIYVPKPKRQYGYYVYPFLLGDELVARVDLKSDRAGGALIVRGAFLEEGRDAGAVSAALAAKLAEMADWLGLQRVVVERHGDLAAPLRSAVQNVAAY